MILCCGAGAQPTQSSQGHVDCDLLLSLLTPWVEFTPQRSQGGEIAVKGQARDGRGTLKGYSKESKVELQKGSVFRSCEHQEEYPN